jgi:hypothetical protein
MSENSKSEKEIKGIYCDTQIQNKSGGGAQYFLDYLGCIYTYEAKDQTKDFYQKTKDFIKTEIPQEDRLECLGKLNSYMNISDVIVPQKFMELIPEKNKMRQKLEEVYRSENIETAFEKDLDLIKSKVKHIRYEFENGLVFSGDSQTLSDSAKISSEDGTTIIKIKSKIKDY